MRKEVIMRFKVIVKTDNKSLRLPMNYNQILKGIINQKLPPNEARLAHDYSANQRKFQKYTFSQIKGKYVVTDNKQLNFVGNPYFYVACIEDDLGYKMMKAFAEGVAFFPQNFQTEVILLPDVDCEGHAIRMLSPVTVRSKDRQTKVETYLYPNTVQFSEAIYRNLLRKYEYYKGSSYEGPFEIAAKEHTIKSVNVNYKGSNIMGFMGEYHLVVSPEAMQLLLDVGLGNKNAQGFGMFEVIK